MPSCHFYGVPEDHLGLLEWLFTERTCHVYPLYSDPDTSLRRFESPEEIIAPFSRLYTTGERWHALYLGLYILDSGPPMQPIRVSLNPESCNGATFRYRLNGWTNVTLYLKAPNADQRLESCETNHATYKAALRWNEFHPEENLDGWDFARINAFSGRLNRQIKKRSIGQWRSRPILPGAEPYWKREQLIP
jgi:hypothetical protein